MSEANFAALQLTAAVIACVVGMACLALAMEGHWAQVRSSRPLSKAGVWRLRGLGALCLAGGLALCLAVDHASMAALVWVMCLAVAALLVALTLTWRPRWLGWLAPLGG
jgi:hypothetical protein